MRTKMRPFKTIPKATALFTPFIAPGHPNLHGIPLGRDLRTDALLYFDPWLLKAEGLIHSTIFLILGDKGFGKSTLQKALVMRLLALQAGVVDGVPQDMRARIHDRKHIEGHAEYQAVTGALHSIVYELNRVGLVNILDPLMGMDEADLVEVGINVCEAVNKAPLQGFQPLAVQVGVNKMLLEAPDATSPELLEVTLRGLTLQDINQYFAASNQRTLRSFKETLADRPEFLRQLKLTMDRPHHIPEVEFQRDATLVSSYLGRLLRGDYGRIFGGRNSLRAALTDPAATWDWTGVNDNARTLLAAMLWKWTGVAQANNDLDLIPHVNIGDEEHEAFRILIYLRFLSDTVKKARSLRTADFRSTQYITALTGAGSEDSEIRNLAQGIVMGTGGYFIARPPSNNEAELEHLSRLGISNLDIEFLTTAPVGCFGFKLPDRPLVLFQLFLTPFEAELMATDQATTFMTTRIPVWDSVELERRAGQHGAVQLGARS